MSVTVSEVNKEVTLQVSGRFDFSCHQDFVAAYKAFPKNERNFVVDLSSTEYMDSSAMGMLLQLREYSDKSVPVALVNANQGVAEILRIANFDKLFTVK
jgi:anti-anti-sigma factor